MRKSLLLALLAAAIAGCAHRPTPVGTDVSDAGHLHVRLLSPEAGFLRFLTSEPAHVAVFEIAPDRGVSLLYPQFREESARLTHAGANIEFLPWRVEGRWFYASAPFYPSFSYFNRPTYLYIIASKSPLRIEDIRLQPARLRSAMGWRSFLASNLSGTLDDLERLVVADVSSEEWSSDLYVMWPETPLDQPWHTQYALVNCPDGRTVVVPLSWNIAACPGTRDLAQATKPPAPTTPDSPPGTVPEVDSTGIPLRPQPDPTDTKPHQPVAPRAIDAFANDGASVQRRPASSPSPTVAREIDAPPPRKVEPVRAAPAPRETPAPRSEPPRSEPPRSEPARAEPRLPPAEPTERVEPKKPDYP